jgi:hypothetical protein
MAPNIEILDLRYHGISSSEPYTPVTFPNLHTLILRNCTYPIPVAFDSPQLKHLWTEQPTTQLEMTSLKLDALAIARTITDRDRARLHLAEENLLCPFKRTPLGLRRIAVMLKRWTCCKNNLHSSADFPSVVKIRLYPSSVFPPPFKWANGARQGTTGYSSCIG